MGTVSVRKVKKMYSLYRSRKEKLKEAFSVSGKKFHSDFYALNGVSFDIGQGECVGIIGLNGSGKSTLLKILAGVIRQTEGEVRINGTVSALLELGAGFHPEYSGMENIYLHAMLMGHSRKEMEQKLDSILEFADLGEFIHQPVKSYSSGMFVRLAFAAAVMIEPDILMIDEALSVGDVFFQQKYYRKVRELAENATVLIVSHDLNAVTKFCTRILVMDKGSIVFDGAPADAVAQYFKLKQGHYNPMLRADIKSSHDQFMDAFLKPQEECYSGKMQAVIEKYYYAVDGEAFGEFCGRYSAVAVSLLVFSKVKMEHVIVGYQVRDKYGNEVFGETSLTSGVEQYELGKGYSLVQFEFSWPEVREGDYFITVGIGEGTGVLEQTEQCWLNNIIHIHASTYGKTIFGIFNCKMDGFRIEGLGR